MNECNNHRCDRLIPVTESYCIFHKGEATAPVPDTRVPETRKGPADRRATVLPEEPAARKAVPLARGLLDYFPNALAAVAELSRIGNEQHNKGQEMHWAKDKSTDHADCILRHLVDRGTIDTDTVRHSTKVAWRALALLETELLAEGAKQGRSVK